MSEPRHPILNVLDQAFDDLGFNDHNMERNRPYTGQPHTDTGERGKTEVRGVTFRDLRDCYIRAWCLSAGLDNPAQYEEAGKGEKAALCENDIYELKGSIDRMAVFQNFACEVERIMGIYPNVPELTWIDPETGEKRSSKDGRP